MASLSNSPELVPQDSSSNKGEIASTLNKLVRAIGRGAQNDGYGYYRSLYQQGQSVIPELVAYFRAQDWSRFGHSFQLAVFSTIVSLIHDIDEKASSELAALLARSPMDKLYQQRLESIRGFSIEDYERCDIRGVRVYIAKKLAPYRRIRPCLERWLSHVPKKDLGQIERLYVIPWGERPDNAGFYVPILYNITVRWDDSLGPRNLLSLLVETETEWTLYHEVGHHVHRHTWGRDSDQEEEAEEYARRRLREAHRSLTVIAHVLNVLTLGILRRRSRKRRSQAAGLPDKEA